MPSFVDTIEDAQKWEKLGVKYLSYSVDVGLFYEKCKTDVETMKMLSYFNRQGGWPRRDEISLPTSTTRR